MRVNRDEKTVKFRFQELSKRETQVKNQLKREISRSNTDTLTGLFNRRGFQNRMQNILSMRQQEDCSGFICMMDIDKFKHINDTYGHDIGDKVLEEIGNVISENSRDDDIAARWGGEEFILYVSVSQEELCLEIVSRLLRTIRQLEYKVAETKFSVTLSIGISRLCSDLEQAIKNSDDAMYRAKNNGRNQIVAC